MKKIKSATQPAQLNLFNTQQVSAGTRMSSELQISSVNNTNIVNPNDRYRFKPVNDQYVTLAEHENGGKIIFIA